MSHKNGKSRVIVSLGGTFDVLHKGHEEYIRMGFAHANYAIIYVLSDEYARGLKKYHVRSYASRVQRLTSFLETMCISPKQYEMRAINSLAQLEQELSSEEIGVAIVVPEYLRLFLDMNQKRLANKKPCISIIEKQRTVDPQLGELSSTAIRFPASIFDYIPQTTIDNIQKNKIPNLSINELIHVW